MCQGDYMLYERKNMISENHIFGPPLSLLKLWAALWLTDAILFPTVHNMSTEIHQINNERRFLNVGELHLPCPDS